ncbi:hypothetical protein KC19_10G173300 [Ceratodon purpureus]|uniref:Hexosyltransferase n=1 Tax=Ceratodon purpureus TaxID=3225 RepID=A0A8T0GQ54_CERPU|nr:hypothetical protein KC19_10G173300 [Ceratodon purpureus]
MAFRKTPPNLPVRNNARNGGYRVSVIALLVVSVVAPLLILATRTSSFRSAGVTSDHSAFSTRIEDTRRRSALEGIEALIPKEVLGIVNPNSEGSGPLNLNVVARKEESSSWVQEEGRFVSRKSKSYQDSKAVSEDGDKNKVENEDTDADKSEDGAIKQVVQSKDDGATKSVASATEVVSSINTWKKDSDTENSDALVRLMRDQLIMARAYANIAQGQGHYDLVRDLKLRIKEHTSIVGDANVDAELPASAEDKMKIMSELLAEARDKHYDNSIMVKKLRAMLQSTEDNARMLKKQSTFLSQLAAKTVPKGLHCFSMRLTVEYHMLSSSEQKFQLQERLEDPSLYHYALFSDNILAASVVVNSTVNNAKDPEKHVFHIVTDKLNYGAMKMWFLANPPGDAAIEVQNVDDFKWLNSSYCPVLKQLESSSMKDYYFKADQANPLAAGTSNLKYRNPKYLSMLNHLRFYLPEVFPKLDKIVFLDDDIVVQKDLTPLWEIDLNGNVNGAVETCGATFHRFDKYLNFSNPLISDNFDPMACGWAYGMNVFDLKQWKKQDITGIYHKWQSLNEERTLWKLGTLPPGLITFYNLTQPLEKSWHVLGLGYNPAIEESEIETAAVIHWNGNMKPWLEIGMAQFRPYWSKYVKYNHPYLQQCNINE